MGKLVCKINQLATSLFIRLILFISIKTGMALLLCF